MKRFGMTMFKVSLVTRRTYMFHPTVRSHGMFSSLATSIAKGLSSMTQQKSLNKKDVEKAMEIVENALLEADVAQPIVKQLVSQVSEEAIGAEIRGDKANTLQSILQGKLTQVLGETVSELNIPKRMDSIPIPLTSILVTGIQGSGKTTTSAKLATYISNQHYKVLLVSLDTQRPAAQEQLEILAKSAEIASLPIIPFDSPLLIAKRALDYANKHQIEVIIFDSAGRLHVDDTLMEELSTISNLVNPIEKLLVADSSLGFDAVNISREFKEKIGITGIILSRMDGDSKGGAAISMRSLTNIPIKFIGVGERLGDFEKFIPSGMASRILGGGDVEQLMDKAAQMSSSLSKEKAQEIMGKARAGKFDFEDYLTQLDVMKKAGNLGQLASLFPGMNLGNSLSQVEFVDKHSSIIKKMSTEEKAHPEKLKISSGLRIKIAKQAGVPVLEINRMMAVFDRVKAGFQTMTNMPDFTSRTPEQLLKDPKLKELLHFKTQQLKIKNGKLPDMFAKLK